MSFKEVQIPNNKEKINKPSNIENNDNIKKIYKTIRELSDAECLYLYKILQTLTENGKIKIPHTKHDRLIKYLIGSNPEALLRFLNIPGKFVRLLRTEYADLFPLIYELDSLIELEDEIINLEIQSTSINKKKLCDMSIYQTLATLHTDKPVRTIVLYLDDEEDGICVETIGNMSFEFEKKSLKNINGMKELNSIETKINNNKKLTPYEILVIKTFFYTCVVLNEEKKNLENPQKEKELRFKKCVELVTKIKDEKIKEEIIEFHNFVNKSLVKNEEIQEEIEMILSKNTSMQDTVNEVALKNAEKRAIEKIATEMKKAGVPIETIQQCTKLPIKTINLL